MLLLRRLRFFCVEIADGDRLCRDWRLAGCAEWTDFAGLLTLALRRLRSVRCDLR